MLCTYADPGLPVTTFDFTRTKDGVFIVVSLSFVFKAIKCCSCYFVNYILDMFFFGKIFVFFLVNDGYIKHIIL